MIEKPVNQIDLDSNIIKANDIHSVINIKFTDINNNPVNLENELEYFYLIRHEKYYPVTDITFNNDGLSFKLPNLYKGLYKIEIKDKKGSIYPANDDVSILLNQSFESGKESEFINMKDSILKDVPEIVTDYINDDPERFKGRKGDKGDKGDRGYPGEKGYTGAKGDKGDPGIDGKDGLKGDKGDKGDPGIDGKDGLKGDKGDKGDPGIDGKDGLKGDKGDKGDKGEDASINYGDLGYQNLIDLSLLELFDQGKISKFDLNEGYLEVENANWLVVQKKVFFESKQYNASIKDVSLLNRSNISFNIMNGSTTVQYVNIQKGQDGIIDMTNISPGYYDIRIYFSNSEVITGITRISQPVLVEGKYPVNWSMGKNDRIIYNKSFESSKYHLATIPNQDISGNIETPSIVELANTSNETTQNIKDNKITIEQGIWLVTVNTYITPLDYNGMVVMYLYINENSILRSRLTTSQIKNKSFSHIFKVNDTSLLSLRTSKTSDENIVSFSGHENNKITITRLGGI